MKHCDLIRVYAENKSDAIEKVTCFLHCYQKEKIRIKSVEGGKNFYEVFVSYIDKYEETAVFKSIDFVSQETNKILKYEKM